MIITVRPDRRFERDGDNLKTEVDVPVTTAVLGGEVEVSTPTGKVALTVPAETQSGRNFRLRGRACRSCEVARANAGISSPEPASLLPRILTDRERELYEELAQTPAGEIVLMAQRNESEVAPRIRHRLDHRRRRARRAAIRDIRRRGALWRPQGTLRRYEEWGLLEPVRAGRQRLYSEADIEHVQRSVGWSTTLGSTSPARRRSCICAQQVIALQREMDDLREQFDG